MRFLAQLIWRWLPHRCTFQGATRTEADGHSVHGAECRRCGAAVWFNVKGKG